MVWWSVHGSDWGWIKALSEFCAGHNDCCGPDAEEVAVANRAGRAPSCAEMDAIRTRDLARGWFAAGGGNTIAEINNDVTTYFKLPTELHNYHEWYTVADIENLCNKYHGFPIVVGICQAHNLPFNEQNVFCHYVAILAWDSSARKVLVGNGDTPGHTGPDWYSIDEFKDAQPYGLLVIFDAVAPAPAPSPTGPSMIDLEKDAAGNITGAHDHDHPERHVGSGIAGAINANKQLDHHILTNPGERWIGSRSATILGNDASADSVYTYSAQFGTKSLTGQPDLAILLNDRLATADALGSSVTSLGQQLVAAKQLAADLMAERDTLKQELADCQATPPAPPAPTYTAIEQAALDFAKALEGK